MASQMLIPFFLMPSPAPLPPNLAFGSPLQSPNPPSPPLGLLGEAGECGYGFEEGLGFRKRKRKRIVQKKDMAIYNAIDASVSVRV
ncbi:hypothetical protein VNO78_22484 [Psophocarpus tetragonolobus]|uniref:Uncharacterized protein n=1 Tax=Psophocarpus tetragonolobus TaxID=3891 RepID=A0AAN9S1Q2_PSOTE